MAVSLMAIADAIAAHFEAESALLKRVQSYDELTEGQNTYPTLQVYWVEGECDWQTQTTQTTLSAGVRQQNLTFYADAWVRPRNNIDEGNEELTRLADELWDILADTTDTNQCPYFGLAGVRNFRWTATRITDSYSNVVFNAIRFIIEVRVF